MLLRMNGQLHAQLNYHNMQMCGGHHEPIQKVGEACKEIQGIAAEGSFRSSQGQLGSCCSEPSGMRVSFQRERDDLLQRLRATELACSAAESRYSTAEWALKRTMEELDVALSLG